MSALLDDSLVIVLAGGAGERLFPLTQGSGQTGRLFRRPVPHHRFRPEQLHQLGAAPRSSSRRQYKSLSLNRHIRMGWSIVSEELGEFIEILPPQKRVGEQWYQGTADAVYQNLYSIMRENPRYVIVLAGDHVYKMDYARMLRFHQERQRRASRWRRSKCRSPTRHRFGIVAVDETERVTGFQEKPDAPDHDSGLARLRAGVDGRLHLRHRRARARARSATRTRSDERTTSARTSSRR